MTTNDKKFITCTLPYNNGLPHIGHTLEFVIGDALARYHRGKLGDENVLFNVGLDEHGKKIYDASIKEGKLPLDYLDELEINWRQFCHDFEISFNTFYRTSDYPHYSKVQRFWIELEKRGLIYEKEYSGSYCLGCESFKTERDLVDGKCPEHSNIDISFVEEKNYFFRLSDFKNPLKEIFENNPEIFSPKSKRGEILNLIDDLQDISVSRSRENVSWGIPVPGFSNQTVYVWLDALTNYIFSAGYYSANREFEDWWADTIQIFGPDNIKFQTIVFQGILCAMDIPNTKKFVCHGTVLDKNGRKMSKTVGNVVDPMEQLKKYGIDAVKYFLLAGGNIYDNSSWDEEKLIELYNSHLADDYGNLISRVVTLISRGLEDNKNIDNSYIVLSHSNIENDKIIILIKEQISEIKDLWDDSRITEALIETNKLVKWCNKYINDSQPWKKEGFWWDTLLELHYILIQITDLYRPVFPTKTKEALQSLNELKKIVLFPKIII